MYWYVLVCSGMCWYILVCAGIYWYVLVHTVMYWYVPVFSSDLVEQQLTWGKPFQLILAHCFQEASFHCL